jgi:hypothetical protein
MNNELFEMLRQFNAYITEQVDSRVSKLTSPDPYQSDITKDIDEAFAKAQLEYPKIVNNAKNKWDQNDYAEFDNIMFNIRPILSKNGLGLSQFTVIDSTGGGRVLHTRLRHSSGQWFETRERIIPEKNDDQTYASTLMYKKRHQAMALLNVTISDDPYDDDGQIATLESKKQFAKGTALNTKYDPREESSQTINEHEYEELNYELAQYPDIGEDLLKTLRIQSLRDMPKSKYRMAIEKVRNITLARNGLKK